jgi:heat-inducible transcriptional repressor
MVSPRGLEVLRVIVQDYVSSREPVGSKAIVDRHQFGVSAATIRNDMALLEEEELIVAPHTSSGRIPTDKGYRLFVDHLAEAKQISPSQKNSIDLFLNDSVDFDELLSRTVRLLSQLTNQVAIVQYPMLGVTRVRHVELVPLSIRRALCIVITDNGRVEQRLLDLDEDLSESELSELNSCINSQVAGKLLTDLSDSVSSLSSSVSPQLSSVTAHIATVLNDSIHANRQQKLVMAGTANLVRTEEDFTGSIYPVLDAIEEKVILLKLLSEMKADTHEVAVSIGHEHSNSGLEQTSLLATGYTSSGESATLGLLGPTRMDYSNNIASIRAVARYLTRVLDAH